MDSDDKETSSPTSGDTSPIYSSLQSDKQDVSVLPWDRFSRWVYCICVVTFDLELGQAMEVRTMGEICLR